MGEETNQPRDSVVGNLPTFTWSTDDAVRYEVALEALSQLVAACTARISREQAKASPDPAVIAQYTELSASSAARQHTLRSVNQAALAEILNASRDLVERIRSEQ